jgi:hypothetical protein
MVRNGLGNGMRLRTHDLNLVASATAVAASSACGVQLPTPCACNECCATCSGAASRALSVHLRLQQIACTSQAQLHCGQRSSYVGRVAPSGWHIPRSRHEASRWHVSVCEQYCAFPKDAGDPNERRTENEKKQLLTTLRVGGLERDPLKRAKQERAWNCDLMSVVSGLGSLWKRVGRVGFPPFRSFRSLDTTLKGQGIETPAGKP